MASAVVRPATQQMIRLPEIPHPLSRMSSPRDLGIRGVSRHGKGNRAASSFSLSSSQGRPLTCETPSLIPKRHSASRCSKVSRSLPESPLFRSAIPEGVEVILGDPEKTKLPIFGNRAEFESRDGSRGDLTSRRELTSRASGRLSATSTQRRLEIDQLEAILREKVKNNYYEVKKRFKDNDPEQKGIVSREALFRVLLTVLGCPLSQNQFTRLLERLCLQDKLAISFTDFYTPLREVESSGFPRWVDPIHRQRTERTNMAASQVHAHLKQKVQQSMQNVTDMMLGDGSGHIPKSEFRNVLGRMGFVMEDGEFNKLWTRYDSTGKGIITVDELMKRLGGAMGSHADAPSTPAYSEDGEQSNRPSPKKKEVERQRSLTIEKWLKEKFREGFYKMKEVFRSRDTDKTGLITHDDFLDILAEFGLKLEKCHLAEFLARCSIQPTRKEVPYIDFLHRFQDRSEAGMAHHVLTDTKHRYNRNKSPDAKSTFSALESQLINMFQRDFLSLLGTLHKIDKLGMDVLSQEEFRAAIESRFDLELTETQFQALMDQVPTDRDGNVRYPEFMAQFDTKGKAPSLFADMEQSKPKYKPIGALPADPTPSPPPITTPGDRPGPYCDRLVVEPGDNPLLQDARPRRPAPELFRIIRDVIKNNFQAVEEAFYELDELNSRRLSQEMMYKLLQRFDLDPEVTRGEIRDIWKTFITNQDKTLDFHQFTRHFGYTLRSAAFPNAKIMPPRLGDWDFRLRSRKLNCAADMIHDSLRSKIDYMWEDLRKEFVSMDPYGTGCVSQEEFRDVLSELCVHLTTHETDLLCKKFAIKDGRISYIEFLKPFAIRKQAWRNGNHMATLLQHPQSELPLSDIVEPPQRGFRGVTAKIRQMLSGNWKNLRRAFKKVDKNNEGFLSVGEFRSVLKLANVILDEEEIYQLLSQFDEDLTGKVMYTKFLAETFQPAITSHDVKLQNEQIVG